MRRSKIAPFPALAQAPGLCYLPGMRKSPGKAKLRAPTTAAMDARLKRLQLLQTRLTFGAQKTSTKARLNLGAINALAKETASLARDLRWAVREIAELKKRP